MRLRSRALGALLVGFAFASFAGCANGGKQASITFGDDGGEGEDANVSANASAADGGCAAVAASLLASQSSECVSCTTDSCCSSLEQCAATAGCSQIFACLVACSAPGAASGCASACGATAGAAYGTASAVAACQQALCPCSSNGGSSGSGGGSSSSSSGSGGGSSSSSSGSGGGSSSGSSGGGSSGSSGGGDDGGMNPMSDGGSMQPPSDGGDEASPDSCTPDGTCSGDCLDSCGDYDGACCAMDEAGTGEEAACGLAGEPCASNADCCSANCGPAGMAAWMPEAIGTPDESGAPTEAGTSTICR